MRWEEKLLKSRVWYESLKNERATHDDEKKTLLKCCFYFFWKKLNRELFTRRRDVKTQDNKRAIVS
jgi:hypothetical protein